MRNFWLPAFGERKPSYVPRRGRKDGGSNSPKIHKDGVFEYSNQDFNPLRRFSHLYFFSILEPLSLFFPYPSFLCTTLVHWVLNRVRDGGRGRALQVSWVAEALAQTSSVIFLPPPSHCKHPFALSPAGFTTSNHSQLRKYGEVTCSSKKGEK